MPTAPTYPGVYIEEVPSGVRTITGVATSITAFIGRARRGPLNHPVRVQSFGEYERRFGQLWRESTMGHAVSQFFQHGGRDALIVRVFNGDVPTNTATIQLTAGNGTIDITATSPGSWGTHLRTIVDHDSTPNDNDTFNLTVQEMDAPGGTTVVATESFRNVSIVQDSARFADSVLEASSFVRSQTTGADARPAEATNNATDTQSDGGEIHHLLFDSERF